MTRIFTDLTTRAKLILGYGMIIACFVVSLVVVWLNLAALASFNRTLAPLVEVTAGITSNRSSVLAAILATDELERKRLLQEIDEGEMVGADAVARLEAEHTGDMEIDEGVRRLVAAWTAVSSVRGKQILPLIREGKLDAAKTYALGAQGERWQRLRQTALEIDQAVARRARKSIEDARVQIVIAAVAAILLASLLVVLLTRSITGPLEELTAAAERLAAGDLDFDLKVRRSRDEVGRLVTSFEDMSASLRQLAKRAMSIASGDLTPSPTPPAARDVLGQAFATMSENLRQLIGELIEASAVLAAANVNLSSAALQMATSASETAAAVTETTATVKEVKHAAGTSSETAQRFSEQAQAVEKVSRDGKSAVEQSIAGMALVEQHMSSVAADILSLNSQGQTIGAIIATVDDLAGRSKMLAINASIEAAKAGEDGKGFGVVAEHVKDLAAQSRQATSRVRGILSLIEKATNSAVLATEQGSKSVEAGLRQAQAAGESIAALATGVAQAAQATTQIAVASREQFIGMDQVARAMENIQEACSKNAAGTRQAEATARRLAVLGQRLTELAARFKV